MFLSLSIFFLTIFLIIIEPKNIHIGTSAIIGAFLAISLGVVNLNDAIEVINLTSDAVLTFLGVVILSIIFEEIGFFAYLSIKMAKISSNGYIFFINSMILSAFVAAFFATDGVILILTPLLLTNLRLLKLNKKAIFAFLFAECFISGSGSLLFHFSNLTNIITANYFHIGFIKYLFDMIIPDIVSVITSIIVLFLVFKKDIPKKIDLTILPKADKFIKNKTLFIFSWIFLIILLSGYFIGDIFKFPTSIFSLGGAIIFFIITSFYKVVDLKHIIKLTPWQIIWFSIGLFIVVYGLKNEGLTDYLHLILKELNEKNSFLAVISTGFISSFLSSIMNNLPTAMIMDISLNHINNLQMIYANIIGTNIGAKITPFGTLSTLLWIHMLKQKNIKIHFKDYFKYAMIVSIVTLIFTLLSLKV